MPTKSDLSRQIDMPRPRPGWARGARGRRGGSEACDDGPGPGRKAAAIGNRRRPCRARRDIRRPLLDRARTARAALQHDHLGCRRAARCRGLSALDRGGAGDRTRLRGPRPAGHSVRRRHLARGPGQRALWRGLDRFPRHEPGARGPSGGPRLRGRAGGDPKAAQRIPARPGRVLPDRSRRRRDARRHDGDPRLGHQRGALRHHEGQRALAQSRARQRRGDHHRAVGRANRRPATISPACSSAPRGRSG